MLFRSTCLLDHELRYTFVSRTVPGHVPEDYLGGHPWDFVVPEKRHQSLRRYLDAYWSRGSSSFGFYWTDPDDRSKSYYFHCKLQWVGSGDVSILQDAWIFRPALMNLTDREREILLRIGEGCGPTFVSHELGISLSTVQTHVARIKKKLELTDHEELVAFGSIYRQAVGGEETSLAFPEGS